MIKIVPKRELTRWKERICLLKPKQKIFFSFFVGYFYWGAKTGSKSMGSYQIELTDWDLHIKTQERVYPQFNTIYALSNKTHSFFTKNSTNNPSHIISYFRHTKLHKISEISFQYYLLTKVTVILPPPTRLHPKSFFSPSSTASYRPFHHYIFSSSPHTHWFPLHCISVPLRRPIRPEFSPLSRFPS